MSQDAFEIDIKEPAMIVIINQFYRENMSQDELFKAASGNWVVGERRKKVEYVFAAAHGIVRQVYRVEDWHPITDDSAKITDRWRFEGHVAEELQHYVDGSIRPYVTRGAQNPVKYVNC